MISGTEESSALLFTDTGAAAPPQEEEEVGLVLPSLNICEEDNAVSLLFMILLRTNLISAMMLCWLLILFWTLQWTSPETIHGLPLLFRWKSSTWTIPLAGRKKDSLPSVIHLWADSTFSTVKSPTPMFILTKSVEPFLQRNILKLRPRLEVAVDFHRRTNDLLAVNNVPRSNMRARNGLRGSRSLEEIFTSQIKMSLVETERTLVCPSPLATCTLVWPSFPTSWLAVLCRRLARILLMSPLVVFSMRLRVQRVWQMLMLYTCQCECYRQTGNISGRNKFKGLAKTNLHD